MKNFASPLADRIDRYLETHEEQRTYCADPGALLRDVKVNWSTWAKWYEPGSKTVGKTTFIIPEEAREAAGDFTRNEKSPIDRNRLESLSRDATTDEARIRLLVATMAWGSGTTNGRGPRNTAKAVADPNLDSTLEKTREHVAIGDLSAAHDAFRLAGIGEAFFTKWFWACSLGFEYRQQALILDLRVRESLWSACGKGWSRPSGSAGYVDYIELLHDVASQLTRTYPNMTAEKIEWLLFDRTKASVPIDQRCFYGSMLHDCE